MGAKLPRSSAQPRTNQAGERTKLLDLPATCPEASPCVDWTMESRAELQVWFYVTKFLCEPLCPHWKWGQ